MPSGGARTTSQTETAFARKSAHASATCLVGLLALCAQEAVAQYAKCAPILDDRERLACYDAVARTEASPATPPSGAAREIAPATEPAAARSTVFERDWELRPDLKRGTFNLLPFHPVYVLVHATDHPNSEPVSPTRSPPAQRVHLDHVEAKLQLSFKTKLMQDALGTATDVWFGYTQLSYWQAANSTYSSPFRETNYQPEIIGIHPLPWKASAIDAGYVAASITHESNGRGEVLSRSWNRLIGEVALESGPWSVQVRPWLRIDTASGDKDDNPDIEDFVGRGELIGAFRKDRHVVTFTGRHTLRGGSHSRGSARIDWAFPLTGKLRGHLQLFSGYGESLIDYNHHQTTVGLGVSFFD